MDKEKKKQQRASKKFIRAVQTHNPDKVHKLLNKELLRAIQLGDDKIARKQLDKGAYVNTLQKDGKTPLHEAAMGGNTEIMQLLLDKGADVNVRDNAGQTPLSIAASKNHTEITTLLRQHGGVG